MLQPHRVQITKEETREKVRTFFFTTIERKITIEV